MLNINDIAPDFCLPDQNNKNHKLSDYRGKWLLIYFYPKDSTPGCTKEACNFRDSYHDYEKIGLKIIGISKDNIESHIKFSNKYSLPFPILSDPELVMIKVYQAWGEKKFMGRKFMGVKRISYLVDPRGKIAKVYEKVNPLFHHKQVFEDITILNSNND